MAERARSSRSLAEYAKSARRGRALGWFMNVRRGTLALSLALHQLALGLSQSEGKEGRMDLTCEGGESDAGSSFVLVSRYGLLTTAFDGTPGGKVLGGGGRKVVEMAADCCGTATGEKRVWEDKEDSMKHAPVLLPPPRVPSPSALTHVASAWSPTPVVDGSAPAPPPSFFHSRPPFF